MTALDDRHDIERAVKSILTAVGEDPLREGLKETPRRVAKMYMEELMSGYEVNPEDLFTTFDSGDYNQLVLVKGIPFYSLCEHHMIPFHGEAAVGYIPQKKVVGLSKIARLVECFAHRLTLQEKLTVDIIDALCEGLKPIRGAMVVIEAEHLCMSMRGVQKPGSRTVTSAVRGDLLTDPASRAEFLALLNRR